jgi:calcineurin-like phosphoesterase
MNLSSKKSYAWVAIVILSITLVSCAGSKSIVVPLNLTSRITDSINIMPFNTTFERKYYSDVHLRGKALLEILIVQEINRRSGLYTYTFDDNDLKNLRTSIIDSLKATNHFRAVNEILATDVTMSDQGKRLYIDFESMGVSQKIRFICEIKARARITDSTEKVLVEKDIYVSEKGTMTLSAAKNKAIEEFILEISRLLNAI